LLSSYGFAVNNANSRFSLNVLPNRMVPPPFTFHPALNGFSILPAFASGFGGRSILHYTVFTFHPARAMT
jgi:hypothetical protein